MKIFSLLPDADKDIFYYFFCRLANFYQGECEMKEAFIKKGIEFPECSLIPG